MLFQNAGHLFVVLMPIGIWAVLMSFVLALLLAVEDGIKQLRRLHQIPCHRCQYYTGSHYLKCPVHPMNAFSEDAIACADYALATRSRRVITRPLRSPLKIFRSRNFRHQ